MATGYKTKRKGDVDGASYMVKTAWKSHEDKKQKDAMEFVNEFVTAPLYNITLYNRAPMIAEVQVTQEQVGLGSKFLPNFKSIYEFCKTDDNDDDLFGSALDYSKLTKATGMEKVFASILAWGETDEHYENIGVMLIDKTENKPEELVFAKIDHGRSATIFFKNTNAAFEKLVGSYATNGYQNHIPLKASKLKESLYQITLISDEEIARLVKSRIYQLKQTGFNIKDVSFKFKERNGELLSEVKFANFDELDNYYISHYIQQMTIMREVCRNLDIIAKISDPHDAFNDRITWNNGGWLSSIKGANPLVWAIKNNKQIENKDPILWAIENSANINLDDEELFDYLLHQARYEKATDNNTHQLMTLVLNTKSGKHDNNMIKSRLAFSEVVSEELNNNCVKVRFHDQPALVQLAMQQKDAPIISRLSQNDLSSKVTPADENIAKLDI